MQRYFFDTFDGLQEVPDGTGHLFEGIRAAKCAAVRALPDMAKDELPDSDERHFSVVVRDQDGRKLVTASLNLHVTYHIASD